MREKIIKNIKKKNKNLSKIELDKKADKILESYEDQNKDRDAVREKEHQAAFQKSITSDFYQHMFAQMDEEE